ncbi:unnamed protein product [Nyctereutes procyonoides]|uniref:Dynein light chain n=1 Tax=Nyctereutes procyonoides TaxID=34880 RepID=A0A811Z4H2_NYCPR|nr:unnamed protein product [Nyctereutes procyonoides]
MLFSSYIVLLAFLWRLSLATIAPARFEHRQPLPQETVAVGRPLLLGNHVRPKGHDKNSDMPVEMQQDSVECATQEFDKKYNPTWHSIVGRNFSSYVTHETKHFIYFYLGQVAFLLFKSG